MYPEQFQEHQEYIHGISRADPEVIQSIKVHIWKQYTNEADSYLLTGFIGRKLPTINEGLYMMSLDNHDKLNSHLMLISSNGEGEAARYLNILRSDPRRFEAASGQHGLLGMIKRNAAKLLPVADEVILDDDIVNGHLALV